jgi:hypothetical protein
MHKLVLTDLSEALAISKSDTSLVENNSTEVLMLG